uniref:borealin isoform X5 n=1 Tax=Oncorhynchus gorbuscha TaxID=8017 RepID=UPI001EAF875D|nr:borealin isoform X5 [Oncorhynchus gorbuscha]
MHRVTMGRPKKTKQRKNPKLDKLEAFLEDFDSEVKTVVERLKERTNGLLKDADNFFNMAVIKLPKTVRQMNWLEHCGSEKPKSPVEDVKLEPGLIHKGHTSPVAIEGEHLPTQVVYVAELQSGQDPGEDDEHADERKIFGCVNPQFNPQVKKPDVEVLG